MLNELEKDKLQFLLNDVILLKAIEKVFNAAIDNIKPKISETNDNNILGQKYRAYDMAKDLLNLGFQNLLMYKIEPKINKEDFNKGR